MVPLFLVSLGANVMSELQTSLKYRLFIAVAEVTINGTKYIHIFGPISSVAFVFCY